MSTCRICCLKSCQKAFWLCPLLGVHFTLFRTVHILRSLSVRSTSPFSHRTHSPQPLCTVHFLFFAPYTFYAASLYGALPLFRTVHILHSLSVRSAPSLPHRTHSTQPLCTFHLLYRTNSTYISL